VPSEQWRAPIAVRVKSVLTAAVGVTIALVFFPLWFAIPIAVSLGVAALGTSVAVDENASLLVLRVGLIIRRIRLADVNAVLVDQAKVTIGRAHGGEISLYAWRRGPLDALLGVPVVAGDIGHAISRAAAGASVPADPPATPGERPPASGRTSARTRSRLATALLGGAGVLAIAGALLVRVHWHSPVLTVLGVIIALGLGIAGLLYLLSALWLLLTGRAPRITFTL
jgi:hypothetical protein